MLTGPDLAKIVTSDGRTAPVVTDGPFQEFKEWIAGFQIVDVESEARAIEIAAQVSAVPGPGGVPLQQPIQVRQVMDRRRPTPRRWTASWPRPAARRELTTAEVPADVEDLLRELAPQVLGVLARRYGDFDAAEDAVQEALLAAAVHWPADGMPDNPRGWLIQTADPPADRPAPQRAVPRGAARTGRCWPSRRPRTYRTRDDTLVVLFLCCHPSLTPASAIALTLRAVGGLTTAEIARAFLVPEATMAQRISRAKQRIKASGVPFRLPTPAERAERLRTVLHVLYLIFNEGYATQQPAATLHRADLSDEAIRLTRTVHRMLPGRRRGGRPARADAAAPTPAGRPAPAPAASWCRCAEQDRTRWDRALIAEGTALLDDAIGARRGRGVPAAGRDRRRARPGRPAPRTPTGRRSSPCTGCWSG